MQHANLAHLFKTALHHYQHRQLDAAEQVCQQILAVQPNSHQTMHLLALCLFAKSPQQAEQLLQKAIALTASTSAQAQQNQYKKTYANFLLSNGRYQAAFSLYQELSSATPNDADIIYGLAFVLLQQQKFRSVLNTLSKIPAQALNIPKWALLKSRALLGCGESEQALTALEQIAPQHSQLPQVLQDKVFILRQQQKPDEALQHLHHFPDGPTKPYLSGCLHYDLQQYEQAEQLLLHAIKLQPDYIDAHTALNKLYWEHNNKERFLASFPQAIQIKPKSIELYLGYISHLLPLNELKQAEQVAQQAIQTCGQHHTLLHALGTIYMKTDRLPQALPLYQQALSQLPGNLRYLLDLANIYIQQADYNQVLPLLEKANSIDPDNQEVWAYLGLCWRLTGNEKSDWLNNYDQLVSVQKLPTPQGYETFAQFWQELKQAIHALHTTERQPLDQSVRHGTQTVGFLFDAPHPAIQAYRALLTDHLNKYLANLPDDPSHPLMRRVAQHFRYSGSWSVKLGQEGFHTNHVHPMGWLSVCTYLQVPAAVNANDPQQQGWLKLGETSLGLGDREQIDQAICPEEGLCVIFPSYIWHGTVPLTMPLTADEARITIPCDLVPDI